MERYKFLDVFQENSDGSLTPKRWIHLNGSTFGPGTTFQKGVAFGGIDFHLYKYWDITGDEKNGILIVTGFIQQ